MPKPASAAILPADDKRLTREQKEAESAVTYIRAIPTDSHVTKPVLLAVDGEAESLRKIERELRSRYGADYRVVCESSSKAAMARLRGFKEAGEDVAVVLADQWMPGMSGVEFLTQAQRLYPTAKRALLSACIHTTLQIPFLLSTALGRIDYYVNKPWCSSDVRFHRIIAEFLYDWPKDHLPRFVEIRVVGEQCSPRSHELM